MKNLTVFLSLFFFSFTSVLAQDIYEINETVSSVEWIGKKVTGEHFGVINLKSGSYTFENGIIRKGEFIIDMQTIQVTDIEDKENNEKLRGHLVSSDFFGVETHPRGKLTIIKSEKIADNKLKVTAELMLKGISKVIDFKVTMLQEDNKMVAIGEVDVNRTEYDIRYGSGSFFDNLGDKAIKDLFTVKFKVAAVKKN